MSLKKQFLKSKPVCKVAFRLSKTESENASDVKILGSFNNWDKNTESMKRLKSGEFTANVELPVGEDVEFRYYVNGSAWLNDPEADGYIPNAYGDTNGFIRTKA